MIEMRHLRAFQVLAEELHFGRTAQRLRVAQSAISQTIKALESEVGTTLFTRTRRDVRLSPAGEAFLVHARAATYEIERATSAARDASTGVRGRLVVRCVLTSSLSRLPRLLDVFRRRYPDVEIDLAAASTIDQLDALRAGHCHVGIVPRQRDIAPLQLHVLEQEPLCVVVPARHQLAGRSRIALRELAGTGLVFLRASSEPQTHRFFRMRCREAGFEPRIVLEVDQLEMMLGAVAAGIGLACVSGTVGRIRFPGVTLVPLSPQIMTTLCAAWNPATLPAAAARFIELVTAAR